MKSGQEIGWWILAIITVLAVIISFFIPVRQAEYGSDEAFFKAGKQFDKNGDNAAAVQAFQNLVGKYPASPLAPRAQSWIGAIYLKYLQDPAKALAAFEKVSRDYPDFKEFQLPCRDDELSLRLLSVNDLQLRQSYDPKNPPVYYFQFPIKETIADLREQIANARAERPGKPAHRAALETYASNLSDNAKQNVEKNFKTGPTNENNGEACYKYEMEQYAETTSMMNCAVTADVTSGGNTCVSMGANGNSMAVSVNLSRLRLLPGTYELYLALKSDSAATRYRMEFNKAVGIGFDRTDHCAFRTSPAKDQWDLLRLTWLVVTNDTLQGEIRFQADQAGKKLTFDYFMFKPAAPLLKEAVPAEFLNSIGNIQGRITELEKLVKKAEAAHVDTSYARVSLNVARDFAEFSPLEYEEGIQAGYQDDLQEKSRKIERARMQVDYVSNSLSRATVRLQRWIMKPEEQLIVPAPDLSRIKIADGNFTVDNKPVILGGFCGMDRLRDDVSKLKDHGFNLIRIDQHVLLPWTRARFDETTAYLAAASKANLAIYLMLDWAGANGANKAMAPYESSIGCYHFGFDIETLEARTKAVEQGGDFVDKVKTNSQIKTVFSYGLGGEISIPNAPVREGRVVLDNAALYSGRMRNSFQTWLKEKYGVIKQLNNVWNTAYSQFADIECGEATARYRANKAQWYDWHMFKRARGDDFLEFMKKSTLAIDPRLPPSTSVYPGDWVERDTYMGSVNRETVAEMFDINGFDGGPVGQSVNTGSRYFRCYLDMLRSFAPHKPIINIEYAVCCEGLPLRVDDKWLKRLVWEAHLHGLDANIMWIWERKEQKTGWTLNNPLTQPWVLETLGTTYLDLRRLAKYIVLFHDQKSEMAIFYSLSSKLQTSPRTYDLHPEIYYEGLAYHDLPVDFISEEKIAQGLLSKYKVLVIIPPFSEYCLDTAYNGIKKFVDSGGTLVVTATNALCYDEHGRKRNQELPLAGGRFGKGRVDNIPFNDSPEKYFTLIGKVLKQAGVRPAIRVTAADSNEPVYGVEARSLITGEGELLAYLLNTRKTDCRVRARGFADSRPVFDLISNTMVDARNIRLEGQGVMLLVQKKGAHDEK